MPFFATTCFRFFLLSSCSFLFLNSIFLFHKRKSRSESLIVSFFKLIIKYLENWWNLNAINVRCFVRSSAVAFNFNVRRTLFQSDSNSISKTFRFFSLLLSVQLKRFERPFRTIGLNYRSNDWQLISTCTRTHFE